MSKPSPKLQAHEKATHGRREKSPRKDHSPLIVRKGQMIRFIDLFAGIGGMRYGLEDALKRHGVRGECVFTSEWDAFAALTYRRNFRDKHEIFGDITHLEGASFDETKRNVEGAIKEHNVLLAGFPCQPFSIAGVSKKKSLGRAHGFDDPTQGTLFFTLKEIIRVRRPDAFILENVKNLVSHDGGDTYRVIMRALTKDLGYQVHTMILDAKAFVPQHRERLFFVGFRDPRAFQPPVLSKNGPLLKKILRKKVDPKYTLSPKLWAYLKAYADKHKAKGNGFGFGEVGPNDVARTLSARYYKDGSEILVRGLGDRPRRLTPDECQSLMGFPKRFKRPSEISDTRAYKQFGNAVVVPVVEAVACAMLESLQRPVDLRAPSVQVPPRGAKLRLPLSA